VQVQRAGDQAAGHHHTPPPQARLADVVLPPGDRRPRDSPVSHESASIHRISVSPRSASRASRDAAVADSAKPCEPNRLDNHHHTRRLGPPVLWKSGAVLRWMACCDRRRTVESDRSDMSYRVGPVGPIRPAPRCSSGRRRVRAGVEASLRSEPSPVRGRLSSKHLRRRYSVYQGAICGGLRATPLRRLRRFARCHGGRSARLRGGRASTDTTRPPGQSPVPEENQR
jgi:hypothetical protein